MYSTVQRHDWPLLLCSHILAPAEKTRQEGREGRARSNGWRPTSLVSGPPGCSCCPRSGPGIGLQCVRGKLCRWLPGGCACKQHPGRRPHHSKLGTIRRPSCILTLELYYLPFPLPHHGLSPFLFFSPALHNLGFCQIKHHRSNKRSFHTRYHSSNSLQICF